MTDQKASNFVFYGGQPRRVDLTQSEGETVVLELLPGQTEYDTVGIDQVISLTEDETLILRDPAELSDEELQKALEVCRNMRMTASDRPKSKTQRSEARKPKRISPKGPRMTSHLAGLLGIAPEE